MESLPEFFMAKDRNEFYVNQRVRNAFESQGFVVVRGLLSPEELSRFLECVDKSQGIREHSYEVDDGQGHRSRMCLWNHPGDDVAGMISRSQKVAGTFQGLMGGDEVYHYHSKIMMKDPMGCGGFVWHQDYGYWYQNGCLKPEMGTVFIALDRCLRENGCLQVIPGSHKMGRIEHTAMGQQAGVAADKMEAIMQRFQGVVHCLMEPGDAIFFHCNLLHSSDPNMSDLRRWCLAIAYNKRINNPIKEHHCPCYTPLDMVPNSAIMGCDRFDSSTDKWFMDPKEDHSASSLGKKDKE